MSQSLTFRGSGRAVEVTHGTVVTCSDDVAFALLHRVSRQYFLRHRGAKEMLLSGTEDLLGDRRAFVLEEAIPTCKETLGTALDPFTKARFKHKENASVSTKRVKSAAVKRKRDAEEDEVDDEEYFESDVSNDSNEDSG